MVTNGHYSAALRHVRTLFGAGTQGGRTDQQLLEQFRAGDEAAEAAFAALLERHGPMVLHVCRSTLGNSQEIDDAFQATFLVLVRRAGSLWVRDSLGPWLHGVAVRVARQARITSARRRVHERRCAERARMITSGSFLSIEQEEVAHQLHEELNRLPGRYRAPLVLCYLEGLTHEQAAEQLRCPVGTVRSRLARGRERFRAQLIRRGLAPGSGIAGVELLSGPVPLLIPPDLASRVTEAALWQAVGKAAPCLVSSSVIKLTEGVIQTMFLSKLKVTCVSTLLVAVLGTGIGVWARQAAPKVAEEGGRRKFEFYGKSSGSYETKPADFGTDAYYQKVGGNYYRHLAPSSLRPHEIIAMPGATVRIRVENPDKSTTECQATVREDGRLAITEDVANPAREETSRSQRTVTEIIISSHAALEPAPKGQRSQYPLMMEKVAKVPDEPEPKRQGSRYPLMMEKVAKVPYTSPEDTSDHERRLRSLEDKLNRVLEQLQSDAGNRRGRSLFEEQKKSRPLYDAQPK